MAKSAVKFRDTIAQYERLNADAAARHYAPVYLLMGDEIVWLVGRRIDDRYRLTDGTENVLRITKEIV